MKEYIFDTYYRWHLWVMLFAFIALSITGIIFVAELKFIDDRDYILFVIIGIWLLIFYFSLKRLLKIDGKIILNEDYIIIKKGNNETTVIVSEIESYKYQLGRDTQLKLNLRNGFDITVYSNDIFCSNEQLELFCKDFDLFIKKLPTEYNNTYYSDSIRSKEKYRVTEKRILGDVNSDHDGKKDITDKSKDRASLKENKTKLETLETTGKPKKLTSFYEKKWALPVLVISSVIVLGFIVYVYFDGGRIKGVLIASIGGLLAMWGAYFKHNEK
ncbi:hypothetical protein [Halocola ammonii]